MHSQRRAAGCDERPAGLHSLSSRLSLSLSLQRSRSACLQHVVVIAAEGDDALHLGVRLAARQRRRREGEQTDESSGGGGERRRISHCELPAELLTQTAPACRSSTCRAQTTSAGPPCRPPHRARELQNRRGGRGGREERRHRAAGGGELWAAVFGPQARLLHVLLYALAAQHACRRCKKEPAQCTFVRARLSLVPPSMPASSTYAEQCSQ